MTDVIDFNMQKLARTEPSYNVHIWRHGESFSGGISFGSDVEHDTLKVASELIAFSNGLIDASGYESAWYQGLLDERWYVVGGFIIGSTITGVLCALLLG